MATDPTVQDALDLTDPRQVCEWFFHEVRRLSELAGEEVIEENWEQACADDPEMVELFTHTFANLLRAQDAQQRARLREVVG